MNVNFVCFVGTAGPRICKLFNFGVGELCVCG